MKVINKYSFNTKCTVHFSRIALHCTTEDKDGKERKRKGMKKRWKKLERYYAISLASA